MHMPRPSAFADTTAGRSDGAQRFVRHALLALRSSDISVEDEYYRRNFGIERSATSPATTTVPGWAQQVVGTDLLALLSAGPTPSVFSQLRDLGTALSLAGVGGSAVVPVPVPTAQPTSQWVQEGMPAPDVKISFSSASTRRAKSLACR